MRAAHILLFTASALVSGVQVLPEGDPEYRHLVINEIGDKGTDDTCNDEDWVELFNPTASDVSLVGVMIVDDSGHGDEGMVTLGDDTPNTEESGMPAKAVRLGALAVLLYPARRCPTVGRRRPSIEGYKSEVAPSEVELMVLGKLRHARSSSGSRGT